MNIKTLVAAAAIATVSTAAVADVTTTDGELVMIEHNRADMSAELLATLGPVAFAALLAALAAGSGS